MEQERIEDGGKCTNLLASILETRKKNSAKMSKDRRTYLQYQDVLQFHNFNGGQMLRSLRLRTGLVGSDQKQSCVHDSSTIQHGCHQNIVTGTIDKRDMTGSEDTYDEYPLATSTAYMLRENGGNEGEKRTEAISCDDHIRKPRMLVFPPCPSCSSCNMLVVDTLQTRICRSI